MRNSNKTFLVIVVSFLLAGCVAGISPSEGIFIRPVASSSTLEQPVAVAPPEHIVVRSLPAVYYHGDGPSLYHYEDLYYYRYGDREWYYGENEKGPWHRLPEKYHPPQEKEM